MKKTFISSIVFLFLIGCKGSCKNNFSSGVKKFDKNLPSRDQVLREQEKRRRRK